MTVFVRNADIIILTERLTHIRRHSKNVTCVLCAMIHVCHCRHLHLDNRAFSVCVCVCLCVCVFSPVKTVFFHAIGLCILVLFLV